MSADQLLAAPGLAGAHLPAKGLVYSAVLFAAAIIWLTYLLGCCSGAAAALACFRARGRSSPQGHPESPVRRRQKQAEEGKKISPLREGFLTGPRARKDGADGR